MEKGFHETMWIRNWFCVHFGSQTTTNIQKIGSTPSYHQVSLWVFVHHASVCETTQIECVSKTTKKRYSCLHQILSNMNQPSEPNLWKASCSSYYHKEAKSLVNNHSAIKVSSFFNSTCTSESPQMNWYADPPSLLDHILPMQSSGVFCTPWLFFRSFSRSWM